MQISLSDLKAVVDAIDASKHESYEDWLMIGASIYNTSKDAFYIFDSFSRRQSNYNKSSVKVKWNSFATSKLNCASYERLLAIATEDNPSFALDYEEASEAKETNIYSSSSANRKVLDTGLPVKPESDIYNITNLPLDLQRGLFINSVFRAANDTDYIAVATDCSKPVFVQKKDIIAYLNANVKDSAKGWYICCNPLKTNDRKAASVNKYSNLLIESDNLTLEQQKAILQSEKFPCASITYSGSKSYHLLFKIDAFDAEEYNKRVLKVFAYLKSQKISHDIATKDPSRFTRLAGTTRNGIEQSLLSINSGFDSYETWERYIRLKPIMDKLKNDSLAFDTDISKLKTEPLLGNPDSPYLSKGELFSIVGRTKCGKSVLSLQSFMSVSIGRPFIVDSYIEPLKDNIKVLYLDYENEKGNLIKLMNSIIKGGKYSEEDKLRLKRNFNVVHIDEFLKDDALLDYVSGILEISPADIVVLDCLNRSTTSNTENSQEATKLLAKIQTKITQRHNVATCIVQHATKLSRDKSDLYAENPTELDAAGSHVMQAGYRFALHIQPAGTGFTDTYRLLFWARGRDYTLTERDYMYLKRAACATYNTAYWEETTRPDSDTSAIQDSRYCPFSSLFEVTVEEFNDEIIKQFGLDENAKNIKKTLANYRARILKAGFVVKDGLKTSKNQRYTGKDFIRDRQKAKMNTIVVENASIAV